MQTLLLIHGWGGSPKGLWQNLFEEELKEKWKVIFPRFTEPNEPQKNLWLKELEKSTSTVEDWSEVVVLAHSLGCALWLHFAQNHKNIHPKKVILVSPPSDDCGYKKISNFFPLPEEKFKVTKMICSDDDRYIPLEKFRKMSESNQIPMELIPRQGHFDVQAGYGPWPKLMQEL